MLDLISQNATQLYDTETRLRDNMRKVASVKAEALDLTESRTKALPHYLSLPYSKFKLWGLAPPTKSCHLAEVSKFRSFLQKNVRYLKRDRLLLLLIATELFFVAMIRKKANLRHDTENINYANLCARPTIHLFMFIIIHFLQNSVIALNLSLGSSLAFGSNSTHKFFSSCENGVQGCFFFFFL